MTKRINYSSGAPWEDKVGYCRAVKKGNIIMVSGTTAVKDGKIYAPGDAYLQSQRILEIITDALHALGASVEDVVRTTAYVTDISDFDKVGKAHAEVFADIKPAMTMVEVSALVDSNMVVEIEATAVLNV